jgi:hypothetical protein
MQIRNEYNRVGPFGAGKMTKEVNLVRYQISMQTMGAVLGAIFLMGIVADVEAALGNEAGIYVVRAITNDKILPNTFPVSGEKDGTISIVACSGEYESASFVVRAGKEPIMGLTVTATDLKGKDGMIPASSLDLKVVKCWYVGGDNGTVYQHKRLLVPELLVKDDGLVKLNTAEKNNYLKLTFQKGTANAQEKYVCISEEKDWKGLPEELQLSLDEFPIYDSRVLQPVDIQPDTNKQFWITLQVPPNAVSGIYQGMIELRTHEGLVRKIKVRVKVLPFSLSSPYPISSILYKGDLDPAGKGRISTGMASKNEQQYRSEMEDMFAHGVTNPAIFIWWRNFDPKFLGKTLEIRNSVGMGNQPLYNFGERVHEIPATREGFDELKQQAKAYVDFCKSHGATEVYFYGIDEAQGDMLKKQRPIWQAIHEVGGKMFVAGFSNDNFKVMGDIQDLFVCAFAPSKEEAAKWHSKGHQIVNYSNPQTGIEEPMTYRRNYGFLLWQNDYDGAMDHAYMISYRNIWNDFDSHYREENMVYPTADGVVDTLEWEGYREGVDDVRYLMTLLKAIKRAKESNDPKKVKIALVAEKYLEELKAAALQTRNLDTVRMELIFHILKVNGSR